MSSIPATLLLVLLLALQQDPCNSSSSPSLKREAYVSLLYGDFYVLPVRVMMRSLMVNSPDVANGLRNRIVMVTGSTSNRAVQQLRDDGIEVLLVPTVSSPYTHDIKFQQRFLNVMTKLTVFNMTQYSRLVFIDADSLVIRDLSPLFTCGQFCATYINPCYFNSGLMVVTPNSTVSAHMEEVLPSSPSYDGGDQGFLNFYYSELMNAPYFDHTNPPMPEPKLSRLPFSWHVDHSSYFPTFTFEFEKSDRCGPHRDIEWLGPPIAKPWSWYTYALFDLSWTWYEYRRQLSDPYPPNFATRRKAVSIVLICFAAMAWLAHSFEQRRPTPSILLRTLPKFCPFRKLSTAMSAVYPVLLGSCIWLILFAICVVLVPEILSPYAASAVFFSLRVASNLVLLVVVGLVFCLGQRRAARPRATYAVPGKALRDVFRRIACWAIFDAAYLVLVVAGTWQIPFSTMWEKAVIIIVAIVSQLVLVVFMFADSVLSWLRISDTVWSSLPVK